MSNYKFIIEEDVISLKNKYTNYMEEKYIFQFIQNENSEGNINRHYNYQR